jgi:hypothetical protein
LNLVSDAEAPLQNQPDSLHPRWYQAFHRGRRCQLSSEGQLVRVCFVCFEPD